MNPHIPRLEAEVPVTNSSPNKTGALVGALRSRATSGLVSSIARILEKCESEHTVSHLLEVLDPCSSPELVDGLLEFAAHGRVSAAANRALLQYMLPRSSRFRVFACDLLSKPLGQQDASAAYQGMISAAMLLYQSPAEMWTLVSSQLRDDEMGRMILEEYMRLPKIFVDPPKKRILRLNEESLADFYRILMRLYPEEHTTSSALPESRELVELRTDVLRSLTERGTAEACAELERMVPDHPWLNRALAIARVNARERLWQPPTPEEFLRLTADHQKRLVRDDRELLDLLLDSIGRLQKSLQGDTPVNQFLWDGMGAQAKPKDEHAFTDFVKWYLERDLQERGVVLNREVVIRRGQGGRAGERTDIQVDAVVHARAGDSYEVATVIVEVKGSWNSGLRIAMQNQLVERYLAETRVSHGLYLVGWFDNPGDVSSRRTPQDVTLEVLREELNRQAKELSRDGVHVEAFVLDASLR